MWFRYVLLLFLIGCSQSFQCDDGRIVDDLSACEEMSVDKSSCEYDSDCVCGGMDTDTGECFVGNRDYYEANVDKSMECSEFCYGTSNSRVTRCLNDRCTVVEKEKFQDSSLVMSVSYVEDNCSVACSRNFTVYGDGSVYISSGLSETYSQIALSRVDQLASHFRNALDQDCSGDIFYHYSSGEASVSVEGCDHGLMGELKREFQGLEDADPISLEVKSSFLPSEPIVLNIRSSGQYMLGSDLEYFRYTGSGWEPLRTGRLEGCHVTSCLGGVTSQVCSEQVEVNCLQIEDGLRFTWDQKEWITKTIDCGGMVEIESKEEVGLGLYKAVLTYYDNSSCVEPSDVQAEFRIVKESEAKELCLEQGFEWDDCGSGCGPLRSGKRIPEDCPDICVPQCRCPANKPYWDDALGCISGTSLVLEMEDSYALGEVIPVKVTNTGENVISLSGSSTCSKFFRAYDEQGDQIQMYDPEDCELSLIFEHIPANQTKIIGLWDQRDHKDCDDGRCSDVQVPAGNYTVRINDIEASFEILPQRIDRKREYAEGRVIAGFDEDVSNSTAYEIIRELGYTVEEEPYSWQKNSYWLLLEVPVGEEEQAIAVLTQQGEIEYAELDYVVMVS